MYYWILFFFLIGGNAFAQKLKFTEKKWVKKELKELAELDQEYRSKLKFANEDKVALWNLQLKNDSITKERFVNIVKKIGYPSSDRVGLPTAVFLTLHYTQPNDFEELEELFRAELLAGRMPAIEYARWYDRCQINRTGENYFGVYGKKEFCGEELKRINGRRKKIGLPSLENGLCK